MRNVGLCTSISLGLLGVSRFYRGKGDFVYNTAFILLSMATLFLAFPILMNFIRHVTVFIEILNDEKQKAAVNELLGISNTLQHVVGSVFVFSVYTPYRQF